MLNLSPVFGMISINGLNDLPVTGSGSYERNLNVCHLVIGSVCKMLSFYLQLNIYVCIYHNTGRCTVKPVSTHMLSYHTLMCLNIGTHKKH